jgi:hypothetical protein
MLLSDRLIFFPPKAVWFVLGTGLQQHSAPRRYSAAVMHGEMLLKHHRLPL